MTDASNDHPEMEYELNEAQAVLLCEARALLICMKAETEKAAATRDDMIRILLAVRHRRPIPPTPALNALYASQDSLVTPASQAGQAIGGAAPYGSR